MAKEQDGKEKGGKEKILAAIRRAAAELGRAPSRGDLRRITGVSHYRVLAEFATLREAVRAAGLEPNPKGEKISTEDLLADWKRVAEKLGRRPSRAEYVREGKYSAGALTVRFSSWSGISTTKVAKNAQEKPFSRELTRKTRIPEFNHKGHEETQRGKRSGDLVIRRSGDQKTKSVTALTKAEERNHKGHPFDSQGSLRAGYGTQEPSGGVVKHGRVVKPGESGLRGFDRVPLAPVPGPVVGMRRVTEAVAQMVVNTLLGARSGDLVIGRSGDLRTGSASDLSPQLQSPGLGPWGIRKEGDLGPSLAVNAPLVQDDRRKRADFPPHHAKSARVGDPGFAARGLYKDRPVMGEPFDRSPMTNAPVNESGVMVLFGMMAAGLGLQVESVQGKFPDCMAKRQVAPGKWQYLRIEFEYESKNFKLHGHDPKGCDVIVCWRHNWKECPAEIEVVELSRLVGMK
jgi:hypothetical protein